MFLPNKLFWLVLISLTSPGWTYEVPEEKQDVFRKNACPAFLTFINVVYVVGADVELPCYCKPHKVQSVVWFFRKHHAKPEKTRALTKTDILLGSQDPLALRKKFKIRLFHLLIHQATVDNKGIYVCGSREKDFFYAYDMDIQDAAILDENKINLEDDEINSWEMIKPYQLNTTFGPGLECDRCGVPGEQISYGLCFVTSSYLNVRFQGRQREMLSCGSGSIPEPFTYIRKLKISATIQVDCCKVTCPTQPEPSTMMRNIINFFGLGSPHDSAISMTFKDHPAGRALVIGCPKARFNKTIAWDRGSEPIYRFPHLLNVSAIPRLTIDAGYNLHINPAKVEHSGVYTCWLQGRPAAKVTLLIHDLFGSISSIINDPDFLPNLNNLLMLYGGITVGFLLLLVIKTLVECYNGK